MVDTVLIQNINFIQKAILILFFLIISIYYRYFVKEKTSTKDEGSIEEDNNIFKQLIFELFHKLSLVYLILFPVILAFLDANVSFYLFFGSLIGAYLGLIVLFSALFMYQNAAKLWEKVEGWF